MLMHCTTHPYRISGSIFKRIFAPICYLKGHKFWKCTRITDRAEGKICERCGKFIEGD